MDVGTCLIQTLDGALLMEVEIQPGSSQQGVTGFNEWRSRLVISVKAEAKQGQANRAVIHVIAQQFHLRTSDVTVVTGHRSRKKRLRLESLALADLLVRLNEVLEGG
tara:strand:+ start:46839 stop:47159 length:321 start_codon:yes stop_codon:yes gene_type:complete